MSNIGSVSPELVRGVITTKLSDTQIESAISTAMVLYDSKLGSNASVSKALQIEIKRYLAAHFVSIHDPSSKPLKEKLGDASIEYQVNTSKLGDGFLSSVWGQTAAALDPTGALLGGTTVPPRWFALCS